ncbi:MAG: hypothetical protein QOI11_1801 [Candidatus Eremiobacteraeota bacterium]|jgi:hypothetical protein|nr:hypothetical protein [Candidatus Eremiobacteraeota bacterium]
MGLKENVSLSLDADVVSEAKAEAGAGSLSEWMNDAALLRLQAVRLDRFIAQRGIAISPQLLAEVDAEWPDRA